jgi:DNA-binding HxlR family transcriptional regulator
MSYSPRPGCGLAKAIAYLKRQPAGTRMRSRDLAQAIGVKSEDLSNLLRAGVKRGLIVRTEGSAAGSVRKVVVAHYWSLPGKPQRAKDTFQHLALTQLGAQMEWQP